MKGELPGGIEPEAFSSAIRALVRDVVYRNMYSERRVNLKQNSM